MENATAIELQNPFPGFRPFQQKDEYFFFGRDQQIAEVLTNLGSHQFMALLGDSGSGKSSLVKAGIFPSLHGGYLTPYGSKWQMIEFRPRNKPLENLAHAVANLDLEKDYSHEEILEELNLNRAGLVTFLEETFQKTKRNILVYIDQFEELFSYNFQNQTSENYEIELRKQKTITRTFINLLIQAASKTDRPFFIMLTMRSEFLGQCTEVPGLTQAINKGHYLVPRLTREQFKEGIQGPVLLNGVEISQRLVSRVLNDIPNSQDQLSILQHGLMRTWNNWEKDEEAKAKNLLDLEHYAPLKNSLDTHLGNIYSSLDKKQKFICEKIFVRLSGNLFDRPGVRTPTSLQELKAICEADQEVEDVINAFRGPNENFLTPYKFETQNLSDEDIIDISHESIMRNWSQLKIWIREEENRAKIFIDLYEAESNLKAFWRNPDLQQALDSSKDVNEPWLQRYVEKPESAFAFLIASKEAFAKEQRSRRLRLFAFGIIIPALLVLGYLWYSTNNQKNELSAAYSESTRLNTLLAEEKEIAFSAKEEALNEKSKADEKTLEAIKQAKRADQASNYALLKAEEARIEAIKAKKSERQAILANEKFTASETKRIQAELETKKIKKLEKLRGVMRTLVNKASINFNETWLETAALCLKYYQAEGGNLKQESYKSLKFLTTNLVAGRNIRLSQLNSHKIWGFPYQMINGNTYYIDSNGYLMLDNGVTTKKLVNKVFLNPIQLEVSPTNEVIYIYDQVSEHSRNDYKDYYPDYNLIFKVDASLHLDSVKVEGFHSNGEFDMFTNTSGTTLYYCYEETGFFEWQGGNKISRITLSKNLFPVSAYLQGYGATDEGLYVQFAYDSIILYVKDRKSYTANKTFNLYNEHPYDGKIGFLPVSVGLFEDRKVFYFDPNFIVYNGSKPVYKKEIYLQGDYCYTSFDNRLEKIELKDTKKDYFNNKELIGSLNINNTKVESFYPVDGDNKIRFLVWIPGLDPGTTGVIVNFDYYPNNHDLGYLSKGFTSKDRPLTKSEFASVFDYKKPKFDEFGDWNVKFDEQGNIIDEPDREVLFSYETFLELDKYPSNQ